MPTDSCNNLPIRSAQVITGRFAPSPSGPLHAGSALAAIGSYLSAKTQGGRWLLRIDDIDGARCRPEAPEQILRQLDSLGLAWDGPIRYQSQHLEQYAAALRHLQEQELAYPCDCTRQSLVQRSCTCRGRPPRRPRAWRLDLRGLPHTTWYDRYLGRQEPSFPKHPPVLLRADGPFAYLLCCVVDDAEQGITEIIRGADLAAITPLQQYLQRQLGLPSAQYGHLPLVYDQNGKKLSKSDGAAAFDARIIWEQSLQAMGWDTPAELRGASPEEWRDWSLAEGVRQWNLEK
ncbi:tRNA glutamyl-Q(34) synthetase GluQRS [Acidithiobacillus sp. AMEEHan]|uniref:tRNA glutamyl-Q(34) synthetase GluQRS n=1 Tax=Acidithiobacillus sp. AMEEHan TaxID=2994951 RepID=UPI0027E54280|nr:tRNA glutamyl-Q(34) synthetase GluQRS [Acidithiobacillus sp. AMEEHan]